MSAYEGADDWIPLLVARYGDAGSTRSHAVSGESQRHRDPPNAIRRRWMRMPPHQRPRCQGRQESTRRPHEARLLPGCGVRRAVDEVHAASRAVSEPPTDRYSERKEERATRRHKCVEAYMSCASCPSGRDTLRFGPVNPSRLPSSDWASSSLAWGHILFPGCVRRQIAGTPVAALWFSAASTWAARVRSVRSCTVAHSAQGGEAPPGSVMRMSCGYGLALALDWRLPASASWSGKRRLMSAFAILAVSRQEGWRDHT